MSEKKLTAHLTTIAERDVPDSLDLWPEIRARVAAKGATRPQPPTNGGVAWYSRLASPFRSVGRLAWAALFVVLVGGLWLTLQSMGGDGGATTPSDPVVIVTHDPGNLPAGCQPEEAAHFVMGFLDAWNQGNETQLATFFDDDFEIFSITTHSPNGEARTFMAYDERSGIRMPSRDAQQLDLGDQTAVLPHLLERQARGERFRLLRLSVNYSRPNQSGTGEEIGIGFLLAASGIVGNDGQEVVFAGTGEMNCPMQTIESWSMMEKTPLDAQALRDPTVPCPEPADDVPEKAIIVCGPEEQMASDGSTPSPVTATLTPAATPTPGPTVTTSTPDSNIVREHSYASQSPDGAWVAETVELEDATGRLYVRFIVEKVDGTQRWSVVDEERPAGPGFPTPLVLHWAADGTYLIYTEVGRPGGCPLSPFHQGLYRVDLADGSLRTVADDIESYSALSPDASRVAYHAGYPTQPGGWILKVRGLESGEEQDYTLDLAEGTGIVNFVWSPDATRLLIVIDSGECGEPSRSLLLLDLASGTTTTLTEGQPHAFRTEAWTEPATALLLDGEGNEVRLNVESGVLEGLPEISTTPEHAD